MSTRGCVAAIATLCAISLSLMGCEDQAPTQKTLIRPVKSEVVENVANEARRSFPGKVEAGKKVELAFQVSGVINTLPVKKGQSVKEDEVVAQIDQRDFRSNLNAARASYTKAKADYDRGQQIFQRKLLSRADLDKLRASRDISYSELEKARKAFKDTTLKAPFTGVVADLYVDNFQDIAAKTPILTLQDASVLDISIQVPEHLIAQNPNRTYERLELYAEFESAPDKRFPLTIKEFSTKADPQTQTFEYILGMDSPGELNLLPGMTTTVHALRTDINPDEANIIVIPLSAVFNDEVTPDESYVWVVGPENTVQKQKVSLGPVTGSNIRIDSGLEAGQRVVTAGVHYLQPDQKVRLLAEDQE